MIRMLAALILLACVGVVSAQEKTKSPKIIYHAHSFFEVVSSKGTVVVFDPHMIQFYPRLTDLKGDIKTVKSDIVLLSHNHSDHTQLEALDKDMIKSKKTKIITGWKGVGRRAVWNEVDTKIKDVKIRTVGAYHDTTQGMENGINTIFVIEVDGWTIAHLGDLGHTLTKKQIKQIGKVDVLMVPVGGLYALNGTEAKKVMKQIQPKEYVIPMHYGTLHFDELLTEEEFLEDQPERQVVRLPVNELRLVRDQQGPRPITVVMNYLPKVPKKK